MARPRGHRLSPPAFEFASNAAGLTITQLAERSDIPRATISGLLGGHHRASVKMVTALADALTCPAAVLFPTMLSVFEESADAKAAA